MSTAGHEHEKELKSMLGDFSFPDYTLPERYAHIPSMKTCADVKPNLTPVVVNLVHSETSEEPCREGKRKDLTPDADRQRGRTSSDPFVRDLHKNVGNRANILGPVVFEYPDDFVVPEAKPKKMEPDIFQADLVLMAGEINQCPAVDIEVNDVVDLFEKEQDFGRHLAMVYGDDTNDIRRLAKLMGLDVEES